MITARASVAIAIGLGVLIITGSGISTSAKADVTVERDVSYGQVGGVDLKLDVYRPEKPGLRPAVVMIHGGGWSMGDKGWYALFARRLAADGIVAFSVNYRLAPKFPYPAQIDDVQRAVRWIRYHASQYSLDPERVAALGDSAGGYLAAVLGTEDTRDNSDATLAQYSSRVRAVVDLYGPTDFTAPPTSASTAGIRILTTFFGKDPTSDPELLKRASPVVYVDGKSAEFLILHGTADNLVPIDQSVRMAAALRAASIHCVLIEFYGFPHGFFVPMGSPPPEAAASVESFLIRVMGP